VRITEFTENTEGSKHSTKDLPPTVGIAAAVVAVSDGLKLAYDSAGVA